MRDRQRLLETGPAIRLGLGAPAERVERIDPRVLPIEIVPVPQTAPAAAGPIDGLQCLFGPVRREQPPGDLDGKTRHFPHVFVVLGDECVNVALCVRDLRQ